MSGTRTMSALDRLIPAFEAVGGRARRNTAWTRATGKANVPYSHQMRNRRVSACTTIAGTSPNPRAKEVRPAASSAKPPTPTTRPKSPGPRGSTTTTASTAARSRPAATKGRLMCTFGAPRVRLRDRGSRTNNKHHRAMILRTSATGSTLAPRAWRRTIRKATRTVPLIAAIQKTQSRCMCRRRKEATRPPGASNPRIRNQAAAPSTRKSARMRTALTNKANSLHLERLRPDPSQEPFDLRMSEVTMAESSPFSIALGWPRCPFCPPQAEARGNLLPFLIWATCEPKKGALNPRAASSAGSSARARTL
jgi:hypothetical protein